MPISIILIYLITSIIWVVIFISFFGKRDYIIEIVEWLIRRKSFFERLWNALFAGLFVIAMILANCTVILGAVLICNWQTDSILQALMNVTAASAIPIMIAVTVFGTKGIVSALLEE